MKKILLSVLASLGWLAGVPESHGQAPDLKLAASFGLFTANGNFTNTGTSAITGDIGTNAGILTGFPPGTFTGSSHVVNAISEDAAKDVTGAYNSVANFTSGSALGTTLGNGQVLLPDTYLVGAGATLTGNLDLNGQGNPNALFILKINGPLSVAAVSTVRLINGAAWENVYWVVNGRVDVGASAAFKGTILTNNDINMLANAVLQGRGLSRLGAITVDNNIVTTAAAAPTPLPVQLTSFTTEYQDGNAELRWATASETQNAYFAVQSSVDGRRFSTIGRVRGHATTSVPQVYTCTDANLARYPARVIYYRLKQVDLDSSSHYSPVRTLTQAPIAGLRLYAYPSPSRLPCRLRIDTGQAGPGSLRLMDALGHLVAERRLLLAAGSNTLPLEVAGALAPGIYLLQVTQGALRRTIRLERE